MLDNKRNNISLQSLPNEMIDELLQYGLQPFYLRYSLTVEEYLTLTVSEFIAGYDPRCFVHCLYSDFIDSLTMFLLEIARDEAYRESITDLCITFISHGVNFNMRSDKKMKSFFYALSWAKLLLFKVCYLDATSMSRSLLKFLDSPRLEAIRFNLILWNYPHLQSAFGQLALRKLHSISALPRFASPSSLQCITLRTIRQLLLGPNFKCRVQRLIQEQRLPSLLGQDLLFVAPQRIHIYGSELQMSLKTIDSMNPRILPGISVLY